VRRFRGPDGLFTADAMYDIDSGIHLPTEIIDPTDPIRRKEIPAGAEGEDLLVPVLREGALVYAVPDIHDVQRRTVAQLASLHPSIKRFINPHRYPAGLESRLFDLRQKLIAEAKA
jgi:nicotinate phosphoribosyltransferase